MYIKDHLIKREVFALPSPFAILQLYPSSIRPAQSHNTVPVRIEQGPAVSNTTGPQWRNGEAAWEVEVEEGGWAKVRLHDMAKFRKKGHGFLGEVTIGDLWTLIPLDRAGDHTLSRLVEKGHENVAVSGTLVVHLSSPEIPRYSLPTAATQAQIAYHSPPTTKAAAHRSSQARQSAPPAPVQQQFGLQQPSLFGAVSTYSPFTSPSFAPRQPVTPYRSPHVASYFPAASSDPLAASRGPSAIRSEYPFFSLPHQHSRVLQPCPPDAPPHHLQPQHLHPAQPSSSSPADQAAIAASVPLGGVQRRLTMAEHRRAAAQVRDVDDVLETDSAIGTAGTVPAVPPMPSPAAMAQTLEHFNLPSSASTGATSLPPTRLPPSSAPPSRRTSTNAVLTSSSSPTSPSPATGEDLLGPLPEGWEARTAPNGRTYFVDHKERKTSWNDPRKPRGRSGRSGGAGGGRQSEGGGIREASSAEVSESGSTVRSALTSAPLAPTTAASTAPGNASSTTVPLLTSAPLPAVTPSHAPVSSTVPHDSSAAAHTATSAATPAAATVAAPLEVTDDQLGSLPSGWERRVNASGRAYFVDHNTKTTTWDDPRMPSLNPESDQGKRDFRRKMIYFRSQPSLRPPPGGGDVRLLVRRTSLFEDAFSEIMRYPALELKKRLMVTFRGEEGVDFGGVSREFFFLLSHAIFDPSYCLFEPTEKGNYTLQINPNSGVNEEHLDYFAFVGRLIGLAIFHRRFLDAHFATSIYKCFLDRPVGLEDMAVVDAEMFRSLTWIAENDITDVLDLDFTSSLDNFGSISTIELKPGGVDIPVTEGNKLEYIALLCEHRLRGRVEQQLRAFKAGLDEIVPLKELRVFDEKELELIIGGVGKIDVDDWAANTDYRGWTKDSQVVLWFWQAVRQMPPEKQSRLLQFATGTSLVPPNGFRDLQGSDGPRKFTIDKAVGEGRRALPKSHTCFNRIDLPPYDSLEVLEAKLAFALDEGSTGFNLE
ncbi:hypothetical protein JCM11251_005983 [Rhodosporidiobolus azoricus]